MALDLTATNKQWSASAWIEGYPVRLAGLPTRRFGLDAERSSCLLPLLDTPTSLASLSGENACSVEIGWNGQSVRFFTGYVDPRAATMPTMQRSIGLIDELGKLRFTAGSAIVWNNRSFPNAVTDLLSAAGVERIGTIYNPGISLGAVTPITIEASETLAQAMRELMALGGCAIHSWADGAVRVTSVNGIPAEKMAYSYAYNPQSNELGLIESLAHTGGVEDIVKQVTIRGARLPDGSTPQATRTATLNGVAWNRTLRFVQSSTVADTIAQRELSRRGREKTVVSFSAPLNPMLMPGMTIGFRDPTIGYPGTTRALVWAVESHGPIMHVTLWLGASQVSGYSSLATPSASFALTVERQPVIVGGSTETRAFVQAQDQSWDPDGQIASRTWTASGALPANSTIPNPLFVYPGSVNLSTAAIALTVTDNDGLAGSATAIVAPSNAPIMTRTLSVACGTAGWRLLTDGTAGFRSYTRAGHSCNAVPTFNPGTAFLSGWEDGVVYASSDGLRTTPSAKGTISGVIGCLFVNESIPEDILAGHGNKLSRSRDGGVSWLLLHDFGATVNDCQSSPFDLNELRACAGNALWRSFNGGVNWQQVVTGGSASTAHMMANAPWGHAVAFSGGSTSSNAIRFEENGLSVDWSALGTAAPTSLRAVSPRLNNPGFIAGDGAGRLYTLVQSGSVFTASLAAITDLTGSVSDLIRDGTMEGLVFGADETIGAFKLVNGTAIYVTNATPAKQIGYGPLSLPTSVPQTELLIPGRVQAGTIETNVIWHYVNGSWAAKGSGMLPSGSPAPICRWIAANPLNPDEWLAWYQKGGDILGNSAGGTAAGTLVFPGTSASPLYYSSNAGTTFTAISVPTVYPQVQYTSNVEWSTQANGLWHLFGWAAKSFGVEPAVWWWGNHGSVSSGPHEVTEHGSHESFSTTSTLDGNFAVASPVISTGQFGYITPGGTTLSAGPTLGGTLRAWGYIRCLPGLRGLVSAGKVQTGGELGTSPLLYAPSYTSAGADLVGTLTGVAVTASSDAAWLSTGTSVVRLNGLGGVALITSTEQSGFNTGHIQSPRNGSANIAVRRPSGTESTYVASVCIDNTWQQVPFAAAMDINHNGNYNEHLDDRIEIIVRAT